MRTCNICIWIIFELFIFPTWNTCPLDNFRFFDAILQFIKIISIFSFRTSLVHADRTPFVETPIPIKKGRIGKTEFYHSVPRLRTPTETHLPLKKERKRNKNKTRGGGTGKEESGRERHAEAEKEQRARGREEATLEEDGRCFGGRGGAAAFR